MARKYLYDADFVLDCSKSPSEKSQQFLNYVRSKKDYNRFDADILRNSNVVSADVRDRQSKDRSAPVAFVVYKLLVTPAMTNSANSLHGGAVATAMDMLTSFAISSAAQPGWWEANHVSRTLNCTYLKPIYEGEYARVECEVTSLGKRNGLCRAVIRKWNNAAADGSGGDICYTCEHGKVNVNADATPKL